MNKYVINWSPRFVIGYNFCIVHFMDFDDSIMVCIQHNSIITNSFTTITISCAYATPPHSSQTPGKHWSIYCLWSFSFSESHIIGIIWHAVFSDLLLSLSNIHLTFLCVFLWLDVISFFFFLTSLLEYNCFTMVC